MKNNFVRHHVGQKTHIRGQKIDFLTISWYPMPPDDQIHFALFKAKLILHQWESNSRTFVPKAGSLPHSKQNF
jgi:hypothetical protein